MPRPHLRDPKLEQFWRAKITMWIASGLNIRDFCRQHRLSEPSFYSWRREIASRDGTSIPKPAVTPKPVAVPRRRSAPASRPRPAASAPSHTSAPPPRPSFVALRVIPDTPLEVVLRSGHVLRVPPGYDATHLRAVVTALEATPC